MQIYDYGTAADGTFYYVMEYLPGLTLDELVRQHGPLPPNRAVYLLRQVCSALREAHAQGLIHRDLKPANLMVCERGGVHDVVKVLDFGLVHDVERDPSQDLTKSVATLGDVAGTPAYMAPEVIVGDRPVDHRADLYALGCVAYFLLTGEQVFPRSKPMQSLLDHVNTPPPAPSQHAPVPVPEWLDALVLSCLQKDPDQRPRDADEIVRRIDEHATGDRWTNEEAREWWQTHAPAPAAM